MLKAECPPRLEFMRVRCCILFVALSGSLSAQSQPAPRGVVRGTVLKIADYAIHLQTLAGANVFCEFDAHTYIERDGQRVFAGALKAQDPVEMITDKRGSSCYTRTVRLIASKSKLGAVRAYRSSVDHLYPRGNLTFAGVVRRVSSGQVVLRTREEPEKVVLLREDTRYLDSGNPVGFERLAINTRVFVRAGRNFENELEAYQVIWGEIPGPRTNR
ncbi:MAG TPA: hypothetical protein VES20_13230 [Bryobacteraceae bacterium]|nr:hypothetical protein [Bryobacteraceae bacterium]